MQGMCVCILIVNLLSGGTYMWSLYVVGNLVVGTFMMLSNDLQLGCLVMNDVMLLCNVVLYTRKWLQMKRLATFVLVT
jgi:hypothetical protein